MKPVVNPEGYERFVSHITPRSSSSKNLTLIYGSGDLKAAKVQKKYADIERHIINKYGYLFWKTVNPPGALYHIDINAEKRTMEFTRMM